MVEDKDRAQDLVQKLFKKGLIADSELVAKTERMFMSYKSQKIQDNTVLVKLVTTNEKVDELIRELKSLVARPADSDVAADIVATKLSSGSKDYFKWVKEQVSNKVDKDPETQSDETTVDADGFVQLGKVPKVIG